MGFSQKPHDTFIDVARSRQVGRAYVHNMNAFPTTKPVTIGAPICSRAVYVIAYEPPLLESIKYAEKLKFEGRYEEAVAAYERLISKHPNNIDLKIELIKVHFFFEQYNKAANIAFKAWHHNPNNPEILFLRGRIFQEQKRFDIAILLYERALEQTNISSDIKKRVFLYLGTVYDETKNFDKAIYYTQEALEVDPNFQMAMYNMASYYLFKNDANKDGNYNESISLYKKVNQKILLFELAELHYNNYCVLQLAKEFEKRIGASTDYNYIRQILLGYPINKIPLVLNAFWQYFIKYVPDPPNAGMYDFFKHPQKTIGDGYGDCDDALSFFNDIFKASGIEFVNIKFSHDNNMSHVICAYKINGRKWNSIDSFDLNQMNTPSLSDLVKKINPFATSYETFTVNRHLIEITNVIKI